MTTPTTKVFQSAVEIARRLAQITDKEIENQTIQRYKGIITCPGCGIGIQSNHKNKIRCPICGEEIVVEWRQRKLQRKGFRTI